jgi:outer membrane protein assembly factor BamB
MRRRTLIGGLGVALTSGCLRLSDDETTDGRTSPSTSEASTTTARTTNGTDDRTDGLTDTSDETTTQAATDVKAVTEFDVHGGVMTRRADVLYGFADRSLARFDLSERRVTDRWDVPETSPEHVVLDDETAFCAGSTYEGQSTLAAVDLDSGFNWTFTGEYDRSEPRPMVQDGLIAYASTATDAFPNEDGSENRGRTYVLDAADGSVAWNPDQSPMNEEIYIQGLAVADDTMLVFADSTHVYDFETESYVGTVDLDCGYASPRVVDGVVYCGGYTASCYDMGAREVRWSVENPSPSRAIPSVVDERVYVPTDRGLAALDREDGDRLWFETTLTEVWSSPVEFAGLVWAGGDDGKLYGFDTGDGSLVVEQSFARDRVSTLFVHDDSLFLGSGNTLVQVRPK